jgi:hypothetical protein
MAENNKEDNKLETSPIQIRTESVSDSKTNLLPLPEENDDLSGIIDSVIESVDKFEKEQKKLKNEISSLQKELEEIEKQVPKNIEQENERIKGEISSLQKELEEIEKQVPKTIEQEKPVLSSLAEELGFTNLDQKKNPILHSLAKELGYKDYEELKDALGKEEVGRANKGIMGNVGGIRGAGTGFLGGRELASGFGVGVKKRLASGKTISESLKGGIFDFKETLSLENIKRRSLEKTFSGQGFVSSFARGKLREKYSKKDSETRNDDSQKSEDSDNKSPEKTSKSSNLVFQKMFEGSGLLPQIAKDTKLMNLNLQELVKIWGGKEITEAEKDKSFFEEQDKKEEGIEASRLKKGEKSDVTPKQIEEESGSTIASLIKFFITRFFVKKLLKFFKFLFNYKTLFKLLTKAGPIGLLVGALYSGFQGWKTVFETGSFKEGMIKSWGTMLNLLTFGWLGEDTIRSLFDSLSNFFDPITSTISNIFSGIKDFFIKLFGGKVSVKDESKKEPDNITPEKPTGKVGDIKNDNAESSPVNAESSASGENSRVNRKRIQREILKQKTEQKIEKPKTSTSPTSVPEKQEEKVSIQFSEMKFAENDPENYKKFREFRKQKTKDIYEKNLSRYNLSDKSERGLLMSVRQMSETKAQVEAIKEFKNEIEAAGAGSVQVTNSAGKSSEIVKPSPISDNSKTENVKQETEQKSQKPKTTVSPTAVPEKQEARQKTKSRMKSTGGSLAGVSGVSDIPSPSSNNLSATPTVPSGGEVSSASSEVAESQRMESAADSSSVVNAPTTNNNMGSSQKSKSKPVSVYDDDLIATMSMY